MVYMNEQMDSHRIVSCVVCVVKQIHKSCCPRSKVFFADQNGTGTDTQLTGPTKTRAFSFFNNILQSVS